MHATGNSPPRGGPKRICGRRRRSFLGVYTSWCVLRLLFLSFGSITGGLFIYLFRWEGNSGELMIFEKMPKEQDTKVKLMQKKG